MTHNGFVFSFFSIKIRSTMHDSVFFEKSKIDPEIHGITIFCIPQSFSAMIIPEFCLFESINVENNKETSQVDLVDAFD